MKIQKLKALIEAGKLEASQATKAGTKQSGVAATDEAVAGWKTAGTKDQAWGQPVRQVRTAAPGAARADALGRGTLPEVQWPTSLDEAKQLLQKQGFAVAKENARTSVLRSANGEVSLTRMKVGPNEGYVARAGEQMHVQLGKQVIPPEQWARFSKKYEEVVEGHNAQLRRRPDGLKHSPIPADRSPHHGPQDGVKHLMTLGGGLETITLKRQQVLELFKLKKSLHAAMAEATKNGHRPKHVVIMVEGNDGASKTGNGLALAREFEKMGYQVRTKSFKGPTAAERQDPRGLVGRYEDFVDLEATNKPTVWLLDRGPPGDYVHNPNGDLAAVSSAYQRWEDTLNQQGVLPLKMIFRPGEEAQVDTFAKRTGRSKVSADWLAHRKDLGRDERASLKGAKELVPGLGDFGNAAQSRYFQGRYDAFADANGWTKIETADRHQGRVTTFEHSIQTVKRFGQK